MESCHVSDGPPDTVRLLIRFENEPWNAAAARLRADWGRPLRRFEVMQVISRHGCAGSMTSLMRLRAVRASFPAASRPRANCHTPLWPGTGVRFPRVRCIEAAGVVAQCPGGEFPASLVVALLATWTGPPSEPYPRCFRPPIVR